MSFLFALYLVNKHGSLIYQRIAAQLSPFKKPKGKRASSGGVGVIETSEYRLHCYESATGLAILGLASLKLPTQTCRDLLAEVHVAYCDYVLKNPFQELDMPVHCPAFEQRIMQALAPYVAAHDLS